VLGPWEFSGEPGHVYFVCVCLRCVEFRAGTILIGHFGGVGGGTVRIFLSFSLALQWRVRHGRIGQGGGPFFLCFLQFAVCSFGGWVSAVGNFCVIYFL
jgi:hypothetical protein